MPTNAALASVLQRPLSALALVLQQPPSPVSPCSHHTATLVTDPAITALAAIITLVMFSQPRSQPEPHSQPLLQSALATTTQQLGNQAINSPGAGSPATQ